MEKFRFEYQWSRDNLFISCFAHEIYNYRYHWHNDRYELNIVLDGAMEFCIDTASVHLETNDAVLIAPGTGHASSALLPNTRALVLHFSMLAFKPYLGKEEMYLFPECLSNAENRDDLKFRQLRFYAGSILKAGCTGGKLESLHVKAAMQMLLFILIDSMNPQIVPRPFAEENEQRKEVMKRMISYLEEHYMEKITLEDLAQYSMYNRTYISTLFRNMVGIGFHDYLTRVRFQHALFELATTADTLTDIAIRNGFSDLKSFTLHCREVLHRTPQEYRRELIGKDVAPSLSERMLISGTDAKLQKRLNEWISGSYI